MAEDDKWKDKIIKTPQVLRVDNLADSGIEIKVLGDTVPVAQWEIMGELRKRIKREFDKQGIEIPWPHMKVYFGNERTPTGNRNP
jgi:small conductance mechanosensitive channel